MRLIRNILILIRVLGNADISMPSTSSIQITVYGVTIRLGEGHLYIVVEGRIVMDYQYLYQSCTTEFIRENESLPTDQVEEDEECEGKYKVHS